MPTCLFLRGFATALLPLLAGSCALAQNRSNTPTPSAPPARHVSAASSFGRLPLGFQPNRGQSDAAVQYVARTPQSTVYLTGSDAVLETLALQKDEHQQVHVKNSAAVRMHLAGAAATPIAEAGTILPGTVNYLRGNDRSQWRTNLPQYSSVRLSSVYPGIDVKYYGRGETLEYDFIVAAETDPAQIKLQFQGATARVEKNGSLLLPASNGQDLRFDQPVAYQQIDGVRVPVAAEFQVSTNHDVTFKLGAYDHSKELVIDPTLVFLGTLGTGVQQVNLSQITVDSTGSLYMAGTTNDSTFPVTTGAYQRVCGPAAPNYGTYCAGGGQTAAFVAKISPDGTQLVYATYLSGTQSYEYGDAIAVDAAGVAYLAGRTGSDTFPVTSDAFQKVCYAGVPYFPGGVQTTCDGYYARNGGAGYQSLNTPAYFAKLSANGSQLLYSSYLGGTQPVYPNSIALDATGNIYLSGQVNVFSTSDLTPGQLPTSNKQFTGITPSGYLTVASASNQHGTDQGIGIAAFLSKFSNDGHTLLYGTFFGDNTTAADTYPTTMTVGANGVAFLGGYTDASNFPTTTGAIKASCTSVNTTYGQLYCNVADGYVASFDTTKTGSASLVYSTRLGGTATSQGSNTPDQIVYGLAADGANNAFVTGYTLESTFSVGSGGFQSACPNNTGNIAPTASGYVDRCDSAFVVKLNPTGTAVLAGTFLGGPNLRSAESVAYSVKLDSKGQVYLYGRSSDGGGDFPQVNPLQPYKGGNQLFISAFTPDLSKLLFSTRFGNPSYSDHSVSVAGGMVLDPGDNIYFSGATTDTMFAATTGTYQTAATTGAGQHPFFAKLSKVLQPTAVTASASPNPASQGATVTYKAVVAGLYQNTPVPTGNVTFQFANTTPATAVGTATLDGTGTASFTGPAPAAGAYMLTATYAADTNYDVSTSAAFSFTASSTAVTTTSVLSSAPTAGAGTAVTFTAKVTSSATGTPTGTITFYDGNPAAGGTVLGTGSLSGGTATYMTSSLSVGNHAIYAVYGGDSNFAGSTGTNAEVIAQRAATATSLSSSAASATIGATVTLTATVTSAGTGTPTGTVTFLQGTTTIGTGTLNSTGVATLQVSNLPVGADSLVASYGGDTSFLASNSVPLTQTITAATVAVAINPTTLTVTHGTSGTVTITATPNGAYSGTLAFSCGTLPSNASCSFAPSTLTFTSSGAAQTSTLTFSTQAAHAMLQADPLSRRIFQVVAATLLLPMGLAGFAARRHRIGLLMMYVLMTGAVMGLIGCGGSSSSSSGPSTATTPPGTYTVPLVITTNGTSTTTSLSVVVQ